MNRKENQIYLLHELDDDDKSWINDMFFDNIIPKLKKHHARIGMLNCDFAGEQYKNWMISFKSAGNGFEITGFEYDEEGCSFDLDL